MGCCHDLKHPLLAQSRHGLHISRQHRLEWLFLLPFGVLVRLCLRQVSVGRILFSLVFLLVMLPSSAFAERVIATWYGSEFRGKRTASGHD
jgi:hypothetical protein